MEFLTMPWECFGDQSSQFLQFYRCHSFSSIQKPELENGNRVLLPVSALDRLSVLRIDYPMMFSIQNIHEIKSGLDGQTSHCGVLEFTAEEGFISMPQWMMNNLKLLEGDLVFLKNASLPKGTYVKMQPHDSDFLNLSNPKDVLERTLQKYSCLTSGETIIITHDEKNFLIDILETKPANAISVIETDCEVDFATPLDYKEPERKIAPLAKDGDHQQRNDKPNSNKFVAFSGLARTLDGAPVTGLVEKLEKLDIHEETSSRTCASKKPGKLVFGNSDVIGGKPLKKSTDFLKLPDQIKEKEEVSKTEENKFIPFTGRKHVLLGS
ncbi:hypothetical protein ACH5RR_040181 [Cinchona calisaya]|uniref:Ubiquitin fusion degradaton protein n=1 Tax=Cinchona calisaya TaxID=153742 RepID=A0ABD2XWC2_9GENT